jgi:phosphatidylserine decarboxylase
MKGANAGARSDAGADPLNQADDRHSDSTPRQSLVGRVLQQETLNFTLTNRIPRRLLTRFIGWFSGIEQPLVRDLSIGVFKWFAGDLNLHESRTTTFRSLHDCFTRELKSGARPIDRSDRVVVSPCDAIVGALGGVNDGRLFQAKGLDYTLDELLMDEALIDRHRDGSYVTLRLTSNMYHRFHAPYDCDVDSVQHIPGDVWNVNGPALRRVPRLFCRNERAVIDARLRGSTEAVTLVAVGAILVASICLTFLEEPLDAAHRGPRRFVCRVAVRKGDEMGYFRHGSTILVLATPGLAPIDGLREAKRVRMGEPLLSFDKRVRPSSIRDTRNDGMSRGASCGEGLPQEADDERRQAPEIVRQR